MKITIEQTEDQKLAFTTDGGVDFESAILLLGSAILNISQVTLKNIRNAEIKEAKAKTKAQKQAIEEQAKSDIADRLNFMFSTILNDICPKDPSLALSEVAIATLENEIIDYAYNNHLSIPEALKHYEQGLQHSSVYAGNTTTIKPEAPNET